MDIFKLRKDNILFFFVGVTGTILYNLITKNENTDKYKDDENRDDKSNQFVQDINTKLGLLNNKTSELSEIINNFKINLEEFNSIKNSLDEKTLVLNKKELYLMKEEEKIQKSQEFISIEKIDSNTLNNNKDEKINDN